MAVLSTYRSRVGGNQIEYTEQGTYPTRIAAEQSIRTAVGKSFGHHQPQASHIMNTAGFPNNVSELIINMHTINAVFLFGDTAMNSLVALSLPRSIITICSLMVCIAGIDAHPMLRNYKAPLVMKMVS
ncbi:hypothetical protein QQ045_022127 [Rhodiola kirilowii]